jgi:hypothetical protein
MNDPETDALVEAVHNVAAAGVVPVISAGNDRDDFGLGLGRRARLGARRDRRRRGLEHACLRPRADGERARRPEADPDQQGGERDPGRLGSADQKLVDVGTIVGTDGKGVDRYLCGPATNSRPVEHAAGRLAERRDRARLPRLLHVRVEGARAKAAGAIGIVYVDNRPGEANGVPLDVGIPAGMIADADGAACAQR